MILTAFLALASTILAIGENCESPTSIWDKRTCEIIRRTDKYQSKCRPRRQFPNNGTSHTSNDKLNGVIVMYHGFTACPDSFELLSKEILNQGFMTLAPLLPGQGITLGYGCDRKKECVARHTNPTFLPRDKEGYMDWVDRSLDMVRDELSLIPDSVKAEGFFVGSLGHSAGSAVGLYAMSRPNSPISKFIAINPFFGMTIPPLDFKVEECQTAANPEACLLTILKSKGLANATNTSYGPGAPPRPRLFAQFINSVKHAASKASKAVLEHTIAKTLVHNYDGFFINFLKTLTMIGESGLNSIVALGFDWGQTCVNNADRGGLCGFRYKHVLALQAFSEFSVSQIDSIPAGASLAVLQSEMDGPVGDSITYAIVQRVKSRGVSGSKCRFEMTCPLDKLKFVDNTCGAPHSIFSHPVNERVPPFNLYWERGLFDSVINYFNSDAAIGVTDVKDDPNVCITTDSTVGYGPMFDVIGTRYLAHSREKFGKAV